ncbi:hypothetical protein BH10PSE14_BH10PSE14_41730 [soil metagenome]
MINLLAGANPAIMSNVAAQGAATTTPAYDVATTAYLAAMAVQPDATRAGLIDTLVVGLKSDGIWASLDLLVLPAAHDAQAGLVNAMNPALTATINGAMTFTADRGYAGDGSTGYISTVTNDSGWARFSQNSLTFGCWLNVNAATLNVMGQASGTLLRLNPTNGTSMTARICSTSSVSGAVPTGTGLFMANRSDANTGTIYRNGAQIGTNASYVASAFVGDPLLFGRAATSYTTARAAALVLGGSLDATRQTALYTRLSSYLTAIGAN